MRTPEEVKAHRAEREQRRGRILLPFQIILTVYVLASVVAIPVVMIAGVWGLDTRWVVTGLINGFVGLIVLLTVVSQ